MSTTTLTVPVEHLHVDDLNPRTHVDPDAVDDIAASIADLGGVVQPLHVRPHHTGIGWTVLSGATRLAAARKAGLTSLPVIDHGEIDDHDALLLATLENTARRSMVPSDEARAYRRLVDDGMLQKDVAAACGVSPSRVSNMLKLLELPDDVIAEVDAGELGLSAAIKQVQRSYSSGHGVPRGKAARSARARGPVGAAHLTDQATAKLLGIRPADVRALVDDGDLVRDEESGGLPLHTIADLLARQRATASRSAGPRPLPGHVIVRLPKRTWSDLQREAARRSLTVDELLEAVKFGLRRRAA